MQALIVIPLQVILAVRMNYFFLFLFLACLHHVFCNFEEDNWQDLEKRYREKRVIEKRDMDEALRSPSTQTALGPLLRGSKAFGFEGGCMVTDVPSLQNYSCDNIGCRRWRKSSHTPTSNDREEYTGNLSTTSSGKTCKAWSTIKGQYAGYANTRAEDGNYCRADGQADSSYIFCFISDSEVEECDIPPCLTLKKGKC